MKSQFEMVKEFHQTFGHPVSEKVRTLQAHPWTGEHEEEHTEALNDTLEFMKNDANLSLLGEQHTRARYMLEELVEFMEAGDAVDQTDALVDLLYFTYGTLVMMGIDPQKPFEIVHAANMRKLWPDGKPRWNAEGKIMKPDGWVGPEDELRHYIESLELEK